MAHHDTDDAGVTLIARNKRARFEYEILEKVEAGIVLLGSEVKSLRARKVSLAEAYARFQDGELFLVGCDIAPYAEASYLDHEPKRPRKLLLHRRQLDKLAGKLAERGLTLVPLGMHFNRRGIAKVSLGLARGKQLYDKRRQLKDRQQKRDIARQMRAMAR
jgi:SsrA-binding protein